MSYADDTEYAMLNLFDLAMREEVELDEKSAHLVSAEAKLKAHQWDFQTSDLNEDFSEAYVMAAFNRAATAGLEVDALHKDVAQLQASVGAHQTAIQVICGSILQIAKQGISLVHGGLANAPDGRAVGDQAIKNIIWQARNQAIHYEDGQFNVAVTALFAALEDAHGSVFSLAAHPNQCLAKQVVHLLGWRTYDRYLADARKLGL